jgi:membrane protein YdbS with pleckstrin-like domain
MADDDETGVDYAVGAELGPDEGNTYRVPVTPREHIEHRHAFGGWARDRSHTSHGHDEIPPAVARWLIAGEEHAIVVHRHPAMLARECAILFGALAAAIALNSWAYENDHGRLATPTNVHIIWLMFLVVAAWYAWQAAQFRASWLVITPVRVIVISGLIGRTVKPLPMKRIRDLQLEQGFVARMLGYGTLKTESLGTDHALARIEYVAEPDRIYGAIWGVLLPTKGKSPMPEEVS